MSSYRRTQIYLSEDQVMLVRERARARQESVSDVIRDAIDRYLAQDGEPMNADPIDRLVGKLDLKARDVSGKVDKYLYGPAATSSRKRRRS